MDKGIRLIKEFFNNERDLQYQLFIIVNNDVTSDDCEVQLMRMVSPRLLTMHKRTIAIKRRFHLCDSELERRLRQLLKDFNDVCNLIKIGELEVQ